MDSVVVVLRAARALLSDPGRWCQGTNCRDREGRPLRYNAPNAASYCLVTAVCTQLPDSDQGQAELYLDEIRRTLHMRHRRDPEETLESLHPEYVPRLTQWNDCNGRTHEQVLELLDETIDRLERE